MIGGWSVPRPGRFTPVKDTRYPPHRRLVGHQDKSRYVHKISPPPPTIEFRTVQPVANRYRPHKFLACGPEINIHPQTLKTQWLRFLPPVLTFNNFISLCTFPSSPRMPHTHNNSTSFIWSPKIMFGGQHHEVSHDEIFSSLLLLVSS
jgi:hypothetical protein